MHLFAILFLSIFGWCNNFCPIPQNSLKATNKSKKNKYLVSSHPSCSYLFEAQAYLIAGDNHQAIAYSKKATRFQGVNFQTNFELQEAEIVKATAFFKINEIELGKAAVEQAVLYNAKIKTFSLALQFALVNYAKNNEQLDLAINLLRLMTLESPTVFLQSNGYYLTWFGWLYYSTKQYAEAKKYFNQALVVSSADNSIVLEAYHGRLMVEIALKNVQEAEILIEQAKCFLPDAKKADRYRIYSDEKLLYLSSNQLDKAVQLILFLLQKNAVELEVKNQFKNELVDLLQRRDKINKAQAQAQAKAWQHVQQQAAEEIELQINLKNYQKAGQLFSQFYRVGKKKDLPNKNLFNSGIHLFKIQKKYTAALSLYSKYLDVMDKKSQAYVETFFDYKSLFFRQQLEVGITSKNVFNVLQEIYKTSQLDNPFLISDYTIRIFKQSYAILKVKSPEDFIERFPTQKDFFAPTLFSHFYWGEFWLTQKQYEKAKLEFNILTNTFKNSAVGFAGMQNVFIEENNFQESLQQYALAKNILGARWFGYVQIPLAICFNYFQKNIPTSEIDFLAANLAQSLPNYKNVIYAISSRIYYYRNLLVEAEKMSLLAISYAKPDSSHRDWPYIILGDISSARGDFIKAETHYKTALALAPKVIMTLVGAAQLYQKFNHLDQAKELYKKIVLFSQNEMNFIDEGNQQYLNNALSQAYLNLGQIFLQQNQKQEALKYFQAVIKKGVGKDKKIALQNLTKMRALTNSH